MATRKTLFQDSDLRKANPRLFEISEPAGRSLRGGGVLTARWGALGAVFFYFRYATPERRQVRLPIGAYDPNGRAGLTLAQAREQARALSLRYAECKQAGTDLRATIEAKHTAARQAEAQAAAAATARAAALSRGSLAALLAAYVQHLRAQGKDRTARDAANTISLHVLAPWPDLAARMAAEIAPREITGVLRRLTEAGKGRTAAKLRSFIAAAYSLALRAESDPTAPHAMLSFAIESNPAAATAALSQFNRAKDRALSAAELGAFVRALETLPADPLPDAVRLALMLGGQRGAQMLRLTPDDVNLSARTITLRDGKGRRAQPRAHVLPLVTDEAAAIVARRLAHATALARADGDALAQPPAIFTYDGRRACVQESLGGVVAQLAQAMATDEALIRAGGLSAPFTFGDLRRTAETHLAALGVSRELRGQIQSHGLGGVQVRHYDRHDWSAEKRRALAAWAAFLSGLAAQAVTPIAEHRKRASKPRGAAA